MVGYKQRVAGAFDHRLGVLLLIGGEVWPNLGCELGLLALDPNHAHGELRGMQFKHLAST